MTPMVGGRCELAGGIAAHFWSLASPCAPISSGMSPRFLNSIAIVLLVTAGARG